jgi:hypothetical protein
LFIVIQFKDHEHINLLFIEDVHVVYMLSMIWIPFQSLNVVPGGDASATTQQHLLPHTSVEEEAAVTWMHQAEAEEETTTANAGGAEEEEEEEQNTEQHVVLTPAQVSETISERFAFGPNGSTKA